MIKTSKQLKDLIRNLSKKKSADAQVLMRNYMMERFLERISLSEYRDKFILKGGMLVAAMVGLDARSTMDLDATVRGATLNRETIETIIDGILSAPVDDGVSFQVKSISDIMDEAEYPGVRVSISAAFDGTVTPIKIDISTGDVITPRAVQYHFKLMLEDRSISLWAYNLETVLAEKLESVISRATTNTRMRDFYVIIELDITDDEEAPVYVGGIKNGGNGPDAYSGVVKDVFASVTQVMGVITTDDNAVTTDSVTYDNTESINLVIDDFEQYVYTDPENGNELAYNLYIPEDYSEDEEYPLVLFMADASADGDDVMLVLRQGNGATVWATAEEQEKHACFVLAPQFPVDQPDGISDTVIHLIESLEEEYSIDSSRLYTTGQSAGCIRSFYFGINYPDFFAAYLLVSGQPSDGDDITVMEGDNVWIIVSEGDSRGYPGMTTVVETWEADGVAVTTDVWDATASDEELNSAAEVMRAEGTDVKCTFYAKGTTWDGDPDEEDPNEHNSCMHVAYNVEAVRDWLFDQVLGESNP